MRRVFVRLALIGFGLTVGLLLAEGVIRLALPTGPGGEISLAEYLALPQRSPGDPRLFPEDYNPEFDIRGLYRGADKVSFRAGPNRFIEPEPQGEAKYRVLFLGGSTTEGIFLPPQERWPARLNVPGYLAAYNASMSETGMLGQNQTLKYLAERGYRFDLVVLVTDLNDAAWSRRFAVVDAQYRLADYVSGVKSVYRHDYDLIDNKVPPLRLVLWSRYLVKEILRRKVGADLAKPDMAKLSAPSVTVEYYLQQVRDNQGLPQVRLDECSNVDVENLRQDTMLAAADWQANFPVFKQEVKKLVDAELLVISEPNSYGAPAESFFYADLRVPLLCTTKYGRSIIAPNDSTKVMKERTQAYLQAAAAAGAHTFDLATAMEPYSNGPHGGSYFYDSVHYTPKGTEKVAELLRPVLAGILEKGSY